MTADVGYRHFQLLVHLTCGEDDVRDFPIDELRLVADTSMNFYQCFQ